MTAPRTLDEWRGMARPKSRWRHLAREAMRDVVEAIAIMSPDMLSSPDEILERVDAAYPFGERRYAPYREWLTERRLLIAALNPRAAPTADEAGVCEVAGDLVQLGRVDEARQLLEAEAPNRLSRKCPACGSPPGRQCVALADDASFIALDHPTTVVRSVTPLLVPHASRLVGHLDAGPLFGRREST